VIWTTPELVKRPPEYRAWKRYQPLNQMVEFTGPNGDNLATQISYWQRTHA
jgi:hypothetical protein